MTRLICRRAITVVTTALVMVGAAHAAALPPDKYSDWTKDGEVAVPMRDGIQLSTDVLLPKGATGKLPTILIRTPYNAEKEAGGLRELWLEQGYAVVVQNERGLVLSGGYYKDYLQGAKTDGVDTIDWIVKQPWSSGKVGTIGCSSSGETQWLAAGNNDAAHVAMIPAGTWAVGDLPGNDTRGVFYRGGVPFTGFWAPWYANLAPSERLLLPPNSTQEQRQRLRTSFPLVARDVFDPDHTEQVNPAMFMVLPPKDILRHAGVALTPFDNYITYTPADPRWNQAEHISAEIRPRVPALHVSTLYDPAVVETVRLFKYLQDLGTPNQFLIIGAGSHCSMFRDEQATAMSNAEKAKAIAGAPTAQARAATVDALDFSLAHPKFGDLEGGDARYHGEDHGYAKLFLNWFEHWVNGVPNDVTQMPKVQVYVMNQGWVNDSRWPLKNTHFTNYYLEAHNGSGVHADTGTLATSPPKQPAADSFIYDPLLPTPTLGGGCCGLGVSFDQRPIEARKDVLVYSTPPLEKPVTIAGSVEAVLYVSSSAKDTDFMVKLVDVYPDGRALNLTEDAFRVRFREGYDKQVFMAAGKVYRIDLKEMVAAIRFPVGHRIRLDVASSNFPSYDRNLNTGGNNFDETAWVVARNSVHHGPDHQSHLVLPVIGD
jgi:putative CocE/NonD family hydrolase